MAFVAQELLPQVLPCMAAPDAPGLEAVVVHAFSDGLPALVDLRGQPDLFGYNLRITQVGAADELASAASLVMGQAAEGTPVVHVRGFPYPLREAALAELIRPIEEDLFR